MSQLLVSRQARALVILQELFGGPIRPRIGRTELSELVHQTLMVKEIKTVWNRVSQPIGDPVQELEVLRLRTRTWLVEVADLVTSERGLILKGLPRKQQPIEEPAREMATV